MGEQYSGYTKLTNKQARIVDRIQFIRPQFSKAKIIEVGEAQKWQAFNMIEELGISQQECEHALHSRKFPR